MWILILILALVVGAIYFVLMPSDPYPKYKQNIYLPTDPPPQNQNRKSEPYYEVDKDLGIIKVFDLRVVGTGYNSYKTDVSRQNYLKYIEISDELELELQDDNEHDKNAIAVINKDDIDIGFIGSEHTREIRKLIYEGHAYEVVVKKMLRTKSNELIPVIYVVFYE